MAEAEQSRFPIELHCHSTASDGTFPPAQVVAMAADVECPGRDRTPFELLELGRQALRERIAFRHDTDEDDVFDAAIALDDLVGDSRQGAPDRVGVHDRRL